MGIERLDVITDNHFGMSFGAMESSSGGDYLRVEDVLARLLEIQSNHHRADLLLDAPDAILIRTPYYFGA